MKTKRYRITLTTDPYHSSVVFGNNHGEVLEKNGATPTTCVFEDGFDSLEEAQYRLERIVADTEEYSYEDDDSARDLMEQIKEDYEDAEGEFPDWYEGEGWYYDACLVYKREEDLSFEDDIRLYRIEPYTFDEDEYLWDSDDEPDED